MPLPVSSTKDLLDIAVQLLIIVIPVLVIWLIRMHVKSSAAEKDVATSARLSNAAIDLVEYLDKRDELNLQPDVQKDAHKLGRTLADLVTRASSRFRT